MNFLYRKVIPRVETKANLGDILEKEVDDYFYIKDNELINWQYYKGAKAEVRVTKSGYSYAYKEGGIAYPDRLDRTLDGLF